MRVAHPHRQRGAALLLAMLILTLVATLAGAMVWQQWRAIQVETAERARTQAAWILAGALDWARLILAEDKKGVDHAGEPWALPLAEARLSTFLAADKDASGDDGPEAFLSGSITDAQARYNLANLIQDGRVLATEVEVVKRLFDSIGVSPDLALTVAAGLRDSSGAVPAQSAASLPAGTFLNLPASPNPPLQPRSIDQLRWLGIDRDTVQRLRPYVELLPSGGTKVNLNTAPREVLAAVIDRLDLAGAQTLVQARERKPFEAVGQASALVNQLPMDRVGVASDYFVVRGRLRLGDRVLEERSLVRRKNNEVLTLTRERVNSQDNLP